MGRTRSTSTKRHSLVLSFDLVGSLRLHRWLMKENTDSANHNLVLNYLNFWCDAQKIHQCLNQQIIHMLLEMRGDLLTHYRLICYPHKVQPNMASSLGNTSFIVSTVSGLHAFIMSWTAAASMTLHEPTQVYRVCMHVALAGALLCVCVCVCRTEASRRRRWLIGKEGPPSQRTTPTPSSVPMLLLLWWVSVY